MAEESTTTTATESTTAPAADLVTQAQAADTAAPAAQSAADTATASLEPPASIVGEAGNEKPEDEKTEGAEGEKAKEGDKPAEDKPIEYADFKLPENFAMDEASLKEFKEAAAGAKLTQDQAQAFVDMHAKALQQASTKPYEVWRDTQQKWQDEIKADPEFGGAKLEKETIPAIANAIKAFSPNAEAEKALRQAFHFTGAGNHPEMIRFMARIGKSVMEGTHVGGKPAPGDGGKSAAEKLYPTQAKS